MIVPFEPPLNDREESFYLELVKVRMKNRELEAAIRDEAEYLCRANTPEQIIEIVERLRALPPEGEK